MSTSGFKEADVVIGLPCLKNHWHAAVTGGIKNLRIGATPAISTARPPTFSTACRR
ncbi:MAG: DUF362 domain-containing protein [Firmicutes bacterium]|nr:DUF362 domain-containing protein [Bacillota bacterium]